MLSGRRPDRVNQHCRKMMPGRCRSDEGKLWWVHQGLPWGRHRVPQHWQPADLLALHSQEARSHANAWVHVALSAASQLPQEWLPPSNNGRTHGAREEWTDLLHAAQGTPEQVCWLEQDGKYLPTCSEWLPSSSSVKQPTRRLAFLTRSPRIRSSQRKRKRLIFLPHIAVNQATTSIAVATTVTIIKATDSTAIIADLIIVIETINAMIVVDAMTRTWRTASPTTRRMIASVITSRKRVTRPCTMTSPLCRAPAVRPEKGSILISFALLLSFLLSLKQQKLWKPSCWATWLQAKHSAQTWVFVFWGRWWRTLPSPGQEG